MKILEIIPQLSSGGAERFTVDLCNELSKGNEVYLLILHSLEDKTNFYLSDVSTRVKVLSLSKKKGIDISLMFKIVNLIKEIQPQVVHTHLRALIYVFLATFYFKSIKFFHTIHSDAKKEAGDRLSIVLRKLLFTIKKIRPITISQESDESFYKFYGLNAHLIPNGRNIPPVINVSNSVIEEIEKYKINEKTKILVNLARIDVVKRQTILPKIVQRLNNEGYNFILLLIGSTKYQSLVNEIKSYECPNLYILGERKNPLEYLKMADAYCLCSSYEGMPISLIESLGVGIIPICTPVGGIKNVIDDRINGILAEDLSVDAFYYAMKRFLDMSDTDLKKMKVESKKSYSPFSMTECAAKYVKLFNTKL